MKTSNRLVARTVLSLAVLTAFAGSAVADYTFSDSTFNDADWALNVYTTGSGGSMTPAPFQSLSGNPDTGREVRIVNNGGDSSVRGIHLGTTSDAIFNFAGESVASIVFEIDTLFLGGTNPSGQFVGFALSQGGVDYRAPGERTGAVSLGWVTHTFNLTVADFFRADGLAGSPDFSASGAPLTLGFHTTNVNSAGFGAISEKVLYDNYNVTLSTVPTPGALALAAMGSLMASRRRRQA